MRYLVYSLLIIFASCTHEVKEEMPNPCGTMQNIKYRADVKPIIRKQCAGCHADYLYYDRLNEVINSGAFEKRVLQIRNMPPSGTMDTCEYIILKRWIYNGHSSN